MLFKKVNKKLVKKRTGEVSESYSSGSEENESIRRNLRKKVNKKLVRKRMEDVGESNSNDSEGR